MGKRKSCSFSPCHSVNKEQKLSSTIETGASSAERPQRDYQVFLSFRGRDTRRGFADSLYHSLVDAGVRVFLDNKDLRPGDRIKEILAVINKTQVCIPIFSENYAESKWCLLELAEMVKLKKVIMPIFYNVKAEDVKLKTDLYRSQLRNFRKKRSAKKVEWEKALEKVGASFDTTQLEGNLTDVGEITAWDITQYSGDGQLCKEVVNEILTKLEVKHKILAGSLVGIDHHVNAVRNLVDVRSSDVLFIVIHGMGGVGKTTLAKSIFNGLCNRDGGFDCCCFLDDVRETATIHGINHGIVYLQNKLLSRLSRGTRGIDNIDSGINSIKDVVKNKKVLIILDDLDHHKQIESLAGDSTWFYWGSRIIITTRDLSCVVKHVKVRDNDEVREYKISEMSHGHALQLFSIHAFKMESPPAEYLDISKQFVAACGRLPLALEVMGSFLFHENKELWKSHIRNIASREDIQHKLRISFEALDPRAKEIFLDIACFFVGYKKDYPVYMWEARDFRPDEGIKCLSSMSLVKIFEDNTFWMHDLLRDLGREIVIQENLKHPEKRSRLWLPHEVKHVLSRKKGTSETDALKFHHYEEREHKGFFPKVAITPNQIRPLQNLSFLELRWVRLEGDFEDALRELKWLSWRDVEVKADNLVLEDIVVLDLSCCNATDDFLSTIKIGENLKVLKLSDQKDLIHVTPHNIDKLVDIENKRLCETSTLTKYPEILGNLRSLVELEISCEQLKEIPTSIGNLNNLRVLRLYSNVSSLPSSIGDLKKLEELRAGGQLLENIPEEIGRLLQLRILDVSWSRIRRLPSTIDKLPLLQQLHLECCDELQELPNLPSSLTILHVSSRSLKEIPRLVNLGRLTDLLLRGNNKLKLPEEQHLSPNDLNWINNCRLLERFELRLKNIVSVEMQTGRFSRLKRLTLECANLETVGQLPSSLTTLRLFHCTAGTRLATCLGEMEALSYLELLRSKFIGVLPLPRNLKRLHILKCILPQPSLDLSELKWLQHLKIDGCRELESVCGVENMELLKRISVFGCSSLRQISDLSNFERLVALTDNPTLFEGNGRISVVGSSYFTRFHHILRMFVDFVRNENERRVVGQRESRLLKSYTVR